MIGITKRDKNGKRKEEKLAAAFVRSYVSRTKKNQVQISRDDSLHFFPRSMSRGEEEKERKNPPKSIDFQFCFSCSD